MFSSTGPGPRRRRRPPCGALGVCLALCLAVSAIPSAAATAPAPPGTLAAFRTLDPLLDGLVPGTLYRPAGAGPFPAVVLLHGCGGLGASIYAWGRWLQAAGYEALVVNSMAPRSVKTVCVVGGHPTDRDQALDAFGALEYLRTLPEIDPHRAAVIGWSHGGGAALDIASATFVASALPAGGGFQAVIAFYPECTLLPRRGFSAPTLILIGSEDDWSPPQSCEAGVPPLQAAGAPLEWHLYPTRRMPSTRRGAAGCCTSRDEASRCATTRRPRRTRTRGSPRFWHSTSPPRGLRRTAP